LLGLVGVAILYFERGQNIWGYLILRVKATNIYKKQ